MGVEPFLSSQSLGSSIPLEVVYAPSWFGGVSVGRHRHGTRHPGGCHWCRSGVNDPFRLGVYDAFLHRLVFGWHHFCLCSLRLEWPSWSQRHLLARIRNGLAWPRRLGLRISRHSGGPRLCSRCACSGWSEMGWPNPLRPVFIYVFITFTPFVASLIPRFRVATSLPPLWVG